MRPKGMRLYTVHDNWLRLATVVLAVVLLTAPSAARADNEESLDPTFALTTVPYFPLEGGSNCSLGYAMDVTIDSSGRPLFLDIEGSCAWTVWRANASGGVDTDFGHQGAFPARFSPDDMIRVFEDTQNRVVAIGGDYPQGGGSPWDILYLRLTADGQADPMINPSDPDWQGFRIHDFDGIWHPKHAAMDQQNRVVLAMESTFNEGDDFLLRLTDDGGIDTTFAEFGDLAMGPGENISGVVVDSNNRPVAMVDTASGPRLVRYTTSGDLDISFAGGAVNLPGVAGARGALAVSHNGTLLAGVNTASSSHIVGTQPSGDLLFTTDLPYALDAWTPSAYNIPRSVPFEVDGTGRLVTYDWDNGGLMRFLPNGTSDPDFGDNGTAPLPLTLAFNPIVSVGQDGRVVVVTEDGVVGRLKENPPPSSDDPPQPPGQAFVDVPGSHTFSSDIIWLAEAGITKGCNPPENTRFCPDATVTRGQMAAFLHRALDATVTPSGVATDFTDDDGSTFEADIEWLSATGITTGCNPPTNDRFCPNSPVTRGQMAAFLVRALGYSDDGGGNLFTDDSDSVFETQIDKLATAGVTRGCNPPVNDRFCPTSNVTRGQMAAFLHRALG